MTQRLNRQLKRKKLRQKVVRKNYRSIKLPKSLKIHHLLLVEGWQLVALLGKVQERGHMRNGP